MTRLDELVTAIKRVYASTFSHCAKSYIKATPYRLEEEKMAVIVQKLVGSRPRRTVSTRTFRASPTRTTTIPPVP